MLFTIKIPDDLMNSLVKDAGFDDDEIEIFSGLLESKIIKKKEHYICPGEICPASAYVSKGCLRRYIIDDHAKEVIINFALEGWWVGDLESFLYRKPTAYYIQALEQSELILISRKNFFRACNEIPKYKTFHEEKVQRNHFAMLKRISVAQSGTPEEKYLLLMQEQPQLFQRIPLHYIASYLGIKPESLSRLRKRLSIRPKKS